MKKNVFYLFALICAMSLFVSCGDDDDDKKDNNGVAGTYSGNLGVTIDEKGPISSPQSIELTSPSEGKINFLLKNFILASDESGDPGSVIPVGNIKIADIELVESNGKYTFTKTVDKLKIEAGDKEGIKPTDWMGPILSAQGGIPVTLNGTITGNDIKLDISIPFMNMDITVQFSGTKK